jgi:hypothetical protein
MLNLWKESGDAILCITPAILFIAGGDWLQHAHRANSLFSSRGLPIKIGGICAGFGELDYWLPH